MRPEDILKPTPAGLCSAIGGFHIDPMRPVEKALITHGHSDHARPGHGAVLATQETLDMMRLRYGENFAGTTQAIAYGESLKLGEARVSFHPAGMCSARRRFVWRRTAAGVASGDYRMRADPTCARLELISAMPSSPRRLRAASVPTSRGRRRSGEAAAFGRTVPERAHLVGAYWLGKARRVVALIRGGRLRQRSLSRAIEDVTRCYVSRGVRSRRSAAAISAAGRPGLTGARRSRSAPLGLQDRWTQRFPEPVSAFASGSMRVGASR